MMFTRAQVRKQKPNGGNSSSQRPRTSRSQQQKEQDKYAYDVIKLLVNSTFHTHKH